MFYLRYLGAMFYDGIILAALFILFTALWLFYRHGVAIAPGYTPYQVSLLFIVYGYYFQSYRHGGQTIGMRSWNIKLVPLTSQLSKKQILARLILAIPAFILAILLIKSPMALLNNWTQSQVISV